MDIKMHTLMKRGTWELIKLPARKKPVGVKWVFKVKTNADGNLKKFKARHLKLGYMSLKTWTL